MIRSLLFVLLAVAMIFAAQDGPTTALSEAGAYEWEQDTVVYNAAGMDTVATTSSDTIIAKRRFDPGWEYLLNFGIFTGTNVDSIHIAVRIDSYGKNDSALASAYVDSLFSSTDCRKLLQIHNVPGRKHQVVLQGYGNNGAQVIINEVEIYKRRPVQIMKRW